MKLIMSTAVILATLVSVAVGQGKADLDRLDEKISSHLESKLSGWKHKRLETFGSGPNVLAQSWSSGNSTVKVAVAVRKSPADAKKELQNFLQFKREAQQLTGVGDEGFASGSNDSDIVLRRGRYVIYVTTFVNIDADADARNLSKVEQETRRRSEMQRIGREFAKQLSSIDFQ